MTKTKTKPAGVAADIKRFTGFIAPDGSTHDSIKKATDYTRELKIKEALAEFLKVTPETNPGVNKDPHGELAIYVHTLPDFLFHHKADILAAFNQDVLMRAPRQVKKRVPNAETQAAMVEARAMNEPGFESAKALFDSLDNATRCASVA